jgi:hypothetical protein
MSYKKAIEPTIIGKLIGFTNRWNPFTTQVFAVVEVDAKMINVPIDYRQQKFIQKEHPINSLVPLIFNEGKWQITSRTLLVDHKIFSDGRTVYL